MEQKNRQTGKNPWRFVFLGAAVYGAIKLLGGLGINILYWGIRIKSLFSNSMASSIGIIGGADGPTAIFVTSPAWVHYVVPFLLFIIGVGGYIRLSKRK